MKTNNQSKQSKSKKTFAQKRLIANQIVLGCFIAMTISAVPGLIVSKFYARDISKLDNQQNAIYEKFMACDEFSDAFKSEFTKVSNDYANGVIDYEEFDKKVKHLNSIKYSQEVLESSNNIQLKTEVENIDKQKQERTEKHSSSTISNLSLGGVVSSGVGVFASLIASMIYLSKECNEEKKKAKQNITNGIKYYDSTTGKIKQVQYYDNLVGKSNENEQDLTK